MAGNIAHEINNPITMIQTRARQLEFFQSKGKLTTEKINEISSAIISTTNRITRIVKGLRTVSRDSDKDPFQLEVLRDLLDQALELAQQKLKMAEISLQIVDELKPGQEISCRGTAIAQLLVNLINNAKDAICEFEEKWIEIRLLQKGEFVEIWVTDSGSGIPQDVVDKIFEPFYTTKEVGKGTGLGLSICRRLVEDHGGEFRIDQNCRNTRFIASLPVALEKLLPKAAA
jgi:C4-dicarboxylate-specific signal transduction histidine kinase